MVIRQKIVGGYHQKKIQEIKKSTRYIDVGEYHLTGRQWANKLGVGTNFINTYYRKKW